MSENGKYIPSGRGQGASVKERKRLSRIGQRPETPAERRVRLRRIRTGA